MRTKMRVAVALAAAAVSCATFSPTAQASAAAPAAVMGGCGTFTPCGEATNLTPWGMYITTNLGTGTSGYCDVWNKNGGSTPSSWHAKCDQRYLAPGAHYGGGNIDVDAFTFNDRGYYMTFSTRTWHAAGVWTKITDLQEAKCDDRNGVPECWIG